MAKGYAVDSADVLLSVYGYFLTVDGHAYFHPKELQEKAKLRLSSSYISLLLRDLAQQDLVEDNGYDEDDEALRFTMTKDGILRAEAEISERGLSLEEFEIRFRQTANVGMLVDTDHPYLVEADEALEELEAHLREDNNVGEITPEEREAARNEVRELRSSLKKSKIRTHYLWTKANDILLWIVEKGAGSMVSELGKRALKLIHDFVNVFFN